MKHPIRNRIREIRELKGWSQSELGGKLTPPRHFTEISRWERGLVMPMGQTLIELARVLEVAPGDLYLPSDKTDLSGSSEQAAAAGR